MSNNFLEIYWTDVYKTGHKPMLPVGSVLMQSNFTPRSGKYSNCPNNGKIVSAGQQMMVRKLKEDWDTNFFKRPIEEIDLFGEDMTKMLMFDENNKYNVDHFKELHKLGYLPIEIKSIEEGNLISYKIPFYTIVNTKPLNGEVFDWIVNYLETILSAESWQTPTSATFAHALIKLGRERVLRTDPENLWFVDYQFHDFSMRGMGGKSAIVNSGIGFSMASRGSDTLPVIPAARKYYDEKEPPINSVIASEHAIMCALTGFFLRAKDGTWEKIGELEIETFRYLLNKFPKGILSLVSDTWDLWRVIVDYCRILKDGILARNGKLVIRPDSGDPVDIICGTCEVGKLNYDQTGRAYPDNHQIDNNWKKIWKNKGKYYKLVGLPSHAEWKEVTPTSENKGVIELLYEIFGGDKSSTGFIRLNPKIGAIYGDSITYARAEAIFDRLEAKEFASTNIVLGVGSYSLQYCTRDTHGFAQKATYVEIEYNGVVEGIEIFKDPITDDGIKKSARGLLMVYKDENGEYILKDRCSWDDVNSDRNELKTIFKDGVFYNETTYSKVRERLNSYYK